MGYKAINNSIEETLTNIFNKITFLELEDKHKGEVATKVKEDALGDKLYWIEIFLSAGIAAFGLIQNSVAVVIGAMLIAPLLRPINGLALVIATGEHTFFIKVIKVLILSIIFSILMGFITGFVINLDIETHEILARVNPTLLDLFIAIFSAMIAILSLRFNRLGESVAGVAMAASLMPPLVVVGIEIYLSNFDNALGAFMLFFTNLISIIIVSSITFFLMGFYPHNIQTHKVVFKRLIFVISIFIVISIPLFNSLNLIKEKHKAIENLKKIVNIVLSFKIQKFDIQKIEIKKYNKDEASFHLILKIPENINFYKEFKDDIKNKISNYFNKKINLDIELIRTANIITRKNKKIDFVELYKNKIKQLLSLNKYFNLINVDVQKFDNKYIVKLVGVVTNLNIKEDEIKNKLEGKIKNELNNKNMEFIWVFLPSYSFLDNYEKKQETQIDKKIEFSKQLHYKWESILNNIFTENIKIKNLNVKYKLSGDNLDTKNITSYNISFDIYIPNNSSGYNLKEKLSQINKIFSGETIQFDINKFKYEKVDINLDNLGTGTTILTGDK